MQHDCGAAEAEVLKSFKLSLRQSKSFLPSTPQLGAMPLRYALLAACHTNTCVCMYVHIYMYMFVCVCFCIHVARLIHVAAVFSCQRSPALLATVVHHVFVQHLTSELLCDTIRQL